MSSPKRILGRVSCGIVCGIACVLAASMLLGGCVIQLESARIVQPWESEAAYPTAVYECRGSSNRRAQLSCMHSHGFGPDTRPTLHFQP